MAWTYKQLYTTAYPISQKKYVDQYLHNPVNIVFTLGQYIDTILFIQLCFALERFICSYCQLLGWRFD